LLRLFQTVAVAIELDDLGSVHGDPSATPG
jgi:hypothetical protein